MRDPARIEVVLNELKDLWRKHPDLRFGQLVSIVNRRMNKGGDMFFPEDEKWIEWFKETAKD
jgi:hypothetical protein